VLRSLYRYSVSPVTTPHTGAACGAPDGVVVPSQYVRVGESRPATSAHVMVRSGIPPMIAPDAAGNFRSRRNRTGTHVVSCA